MLVLGHQHKHQRIERDSKNDGKEGEYDLQNPHSGSESRGEGQHNLPLDLTCCTREAKVVESFNFSHTDGRTTLFFVTIADVLCEKSLGESMLVCTISYTIAMYT